MGHAHRSPIPGSSGQPPATRRSGLRSRSTQLLALRFGWVVLVIWFEIGETFRSLSSCRFPDAVLRKVSVHSPTHVVLLADPHVPHPKYSHSATARPWVNSIRQGMEELAMRKSWNTVTRLGRIDAVVVVGDMLDFGRGHMTDLEYDDYYQLFRSIFTLPASTPMYFVPGNHDIPLAGPSVQRYSDDARRRYIQHFGEPNQVVSIGNHSLVLLDSIGLVEEDYRRYAAEMQYGEWDGFGSSVIRFVKDIGDIPAPILISHIPLARAGSASCGPLREHGRIKKGVGPGYQNLLGSETSKFLLDQIKPLAVFSGDDHDYCEVTHENGIKEVTIKTFSPMAGVRHPGLQLLSLVPPIPGQISAVDQPCVLPDHAGVYEWTYPLWGILTLIFIIGSNIRTAWQRRTPRTPSEKLRSDEKFDKPVLPTRRSTQHLQSLNMTGARERYHSSTSAPVSPIHSPRPRGGFHDEEAELGHGFVNSPTISRRPSYMDMTDDSRLAAPPSPSMSRTSGMLNGMAHPTPRRVTLPRMPSATDWASAARAKDVSVLSLVVEGSGRRARLGRIGAFFRWLWQTRNSVFIQSLREFLSIAVPAIITWILVNAMFFPW